MILTKNIVVNGQTIFSGEFVPFLDPTARVQQPMTWLSEHQCALRLAGETHSETPRYIPNAPEVILGNNGGIITTSTYGQNTPDAL